MSKLKYKPNGPQEEYTSFESDDNFYPLLFKCVEAMVENNDYENLSNIEYIERPNPDECQYITIYTKEYIYFSEESPAFSDHDGAVEVALRIYSVKRNP